MREKTRRKGIGDIKIAFVLGTRPEIIKMSPVVHECQRLDIDYFILHTGQHYSYNMDRVFFEELDLPYPKYNLGIGSGTHAEETGKALVGIEKTLRKEKPSITLVEGDTNTVLAGSLAASKLGIPVGHVEAGLRSYDRKMPEETNRVLTDHLSDILFAPTLRAKENLLREGILPSRIHVTGNTIVDCLVKNASLARKRSKASAHSRESYFLLTLHREENVDGKERLQHILEGLRLVYEEFRLPIIYPIHPRTKKRMDEFGLVPTDGLSLIDPVDYFSFLGLEMDAKLVLTDSGGVQEEACILKVPCVTLRENTERPETIDVGANVLAGTEPKEILGKAKFMVNALRNWENPFGDGTAAKQIIKDLSSYLAESHGG